MEGGKRRGDNGYSFQGERKDGGKNVEEQGGKGGK